MMLWQVLLAALALTATADCLVSSQAPGTALPSNSSTACHVTSTVTATWADPASSTRFFSAGSLNIMNTGVTLMPVPWSLTLVNAAYDSEGQAVLLHWEPAPSNTGELTGTVTNYWQTLLGNQANAITLGYVVHAAEPAAAPQAVYINGQRCSLVDATPQAALQSALPSAHLQTSEIGENDTVAPPGVRAATRPAGKPTAEAATKASAEAATKAAAEAAGAAATIEAADVATSFIQAAGLQPMTTLDGQLLGVDGNPVYLHGVNWFGFELSTTMVDGLWQGPDSMTMDFATVIQRIQLLGFNAIRLPFSFPAIFDKAPISYTKRCTQVSPSAISASVVKPGANTNGVAAPQPAYAARQAPGICNAYLPNDSTFNRLIWVVNYLANNGFYVLLDNQFNVEQTATDNPDEWVQLWVRIMAAVTQASPQAAARTMVDIINEPDCQLVKWESAGGMPGAGELYLRVMEALSQVNAGTIFVIEGLGQQGYAKNWGDGLVTDPAIISKNGLSDPNPFFQSLMTQPYLSQVVIGPHLYPPSISTSNWGMTGPDLWNRLSKSFGYFNKGGYCTGATCHVFPVIIGEIGSSLADARDMPSLVDIRSWMLNVAPAADGQHNKVSGYFWWAWNANSGDTKGLVGDDWRSVVWNKIDFLTPLGLRPWYQRVSWRSVAEVYNDTAPASPPATAAAVTAPSSAADDAASAAEAPSAALEATDAVSEPSSAVEAPSTAAMQTAMQPLPVADEQRVAVEQSPAAWDSAPPGESMVPAADLGSLTWSQILHARQQHANLLLRQHPAGTAGTAAALPGPPASQSGPFTPADAPSPAADSFRHDPASQAAMSDIMYSPLNSEPLAPAPAPVTSPEQTGPAPAQVVTAAPQYLTTLDGQLVNAGGNPVQLHGICWGGFDTGAGMLAGACASSPAFEAELSTAILRMQSLGFNAVRLPFSFAALHAEASAATPAACSSQKQAANTCAAAGHEDIAAQMTPPNITIPAGRSFPAQTGFSSPATCGADLSPLTALGRLTLTVKLFRRSNFYVVLANSLTGHRSALSNPNQWVQQWVQLATALGSDPTTSSQIILDLLGDQSSLGSPRLQWQSSKGAIGATELYLAAMDALYAFDEHTLFFIQGVPQSDASHSSGFAPKTTNPADSPTPFFTTLLTKPYAQQVVIAPVVALASPLSGSDAGLYQGWTSAFGYLNMQGFCQTGSCTRFPVVIGSFAANLSSAAGQRQMRFFATYLNAGPAATGGQHTIIDSWFWGSWDSSDALGSPHLQNPDPATAQPSSSAGLGLSLQQPAPAPSTAQQDHSAALQQPIWDNTRAQVAWPIVEFLRDLSLRPWYAPPTVHSFGAVHGVVASAGAASAEAAQPGDTTSSCDVHINITSIGPSLAPAAQPNLTHLAALTLSVSNSGTAPINPPWTLTVASISASPGASYQAVKQSIGLSDVTLRSGVVSGSVGEYWQVIWPGSGAVELSLVVESTQAAFMPSQVQVNGQACAVAAQT